ncbi:hypothetical protein HPB50_002254 [Hyalomma asiaticum]|uniref:Uncharacterized protein n=1 Tax=Hyalomma asiaticum TaxID=266040 RepID=A0ACB7TD04_HYAAI|nr:hypothetical protein HPB50_002254 [Hyalomma asiaticum]
MTWETEKLWRETFARELRTRPESDSTVSKRRPLWWRRRRWPRIGARATHTHRKLAVSQTRGRGIKSVATRSPLSLVEIGAAEPDFQVTKTPARRRQATTTHAERVRSEVWRH